MSNKKEDERLQIMCDCAVNDICPQGRFGHSPQCTILVHPDTLWKTLFPEVLVNAKVDKQ